MAPNTKKQQLFQLLPLPVSWLYSLAIALAWTKKPVLVRRFLSGAVVVSYCLGSQTPILSSLQEYLVDNPLKRVSDNMLFRLRPRTDLFLSLHAVPAIMIMLSNWVPNMPLTIMMTTS